MSFISPYPLTATVTITKSATNYNNSATTGTLGATEYRLLKGIVALTGLGQVANTQLEIEDNNNTLFSTFTVGASVSITIGHITSTVTSIFGGFIERSQVQRQTKGISILKLFCTDFLQKALNKVVLHYEKHQKRDTSNNLVASDAVSMIVTDLIVDLVNQTQVTVYQNGVGSGLSAALTTSTPAGFIVPTLGISIPDVNFVYKPLHDCLKELFDYVRYVWGVDKNGNIYGRPDTSAPDSGVTLDSSTIMSIQVEDDIIDMKNRIFVIGSDQVKAGASSTTTTGGGVMNTSSLYLAQKFTATADELRSIIVYLDKIGAPSNLAVGIYQDNANKPATAVIKYSEINKDVVSSTAAGWNLVEINEKITTQQPYWIVLFRSADTTNYYRWYTGADAVASTATATDGTTWSTVAATSTFAFQANFAIPLIYPAEDIVSTSTYGVRELVWRQPEINNYDIAISLGTLLKQTMAKKKRSLIINAYVPNTILEPGKLVTVSDSSITTTSFIMTDVQYELQGMESFTCQVKAMQYLL